MHRAVVLAALLVTAPSFAADPIYGTWTWNPTRTRAGTGQPSFTCYVTTLEDLGNGKFRETSSRMRPNGEPVQQDGVFAFDGGDHPNGLGNGVTTAFTRIDEHRYAMVGKDHGKAFTTVVRTISDDGNTMLQVGDGSIDGKSFHVELVFERRDSSCAPVKAK